MPFNLLKTYNQHLELAGMNDWQRKNSLMGVFNRDIANNANFKFLGKQITPTPKNGVIEMATLYSHLTTVIIDQTTRERGFDIFRACRLHWIKFHIEQNKKDRILLFTVDEPEGYRTYLYDIDEKYAIVFEPRKNKEEYFLLTAYHLTGKDAKRDKMMKKYKRKLDVIL